MVFFGLCLGSLTELSWLPQAGLGLGRAEGRKEHVPGGAQGLGTGELWGLSSQGCNSVAHCYV